MHTVTNDSINCIIKIITSLFDTIINQIIKFIIKFFIIDLSKLYDLVSHYIISINQMFFCRKNLAVISRLTSQSLIFCSTSQLFIFFVYIISFLFHLLFFHLLFFLFFFFFSFHHNLLSSS